MKNNGKNASVLYLFATLFNKGIAFLTVPIFTRILSTTDYGIVTTYNAWVDILTVILSLALYMAIRIAFVDLKKEKKTFLNTVISFTLVLSFIFAIGALLLGKAFTGISGIIVLLAVVQGSAGALIMDYQQYLMMDYKYVQRSLLMALPNLLAVICSIFAIVYIHPEQLYLGRIVPTMSVYAISAGVVVYQTYKNQVPHINISHLKYGIAISLPLVFHGIALNVLSQSDRTMITLLAGADQTGIYSLVYNFSMISAVLTTALDGVWLPWFMTKMKERQYEQINAQAKDYIEFMTFAMFGLILIGPEILKKMAAQTYWDGISIIPPIVLANYFIFMYTFFVNVEHYNKKTMGITINTVVAAVVNIGLNFIFIPLYGYVAAAYTTLASYCIAMLLHANASHKLEKSVLPTTQFVLPLVILLVATILYYCLLDQWIIRWAIAFGVVMIVATFERRKIMQYLGIKKGLRKDE